MLRFVLALLGAMLVLVMAPTLAFATDVVIVATPANDPIAARVEDELEALGFQVVETIVEPDATIESIVAGREYAKAVVHVRPPGADVWIVDPTPVLRESIQPSKTSKNQVALRAVEVVRGSLLKPTPPPPKPEPPKPPPKVEPARVAAVEPLPRSRAFELAIGAAVPTASPPSLGLAAQLGAHAVGPLDVDALLIYAPRLRAVTEPEGNARLAWGLATARVRYRFSWGGQRTALHLGVGGGVASGWASATAVAPFAASSTTLLSPAFIASATLKVRLAGPFDLWVDLSAVVTRGMVLRILDRDVARVSTTAWLVSGVGLSFE